MDRATSCRMNLNRSWMVLGIEKIYIFASHAPGEEEVRFPPYTFVLYYYYWASVV